MPWPICDTIGLYYELVTTSTVVIFIADDETLLEMAWHSCVESSRT